MDKNDYTDPICPFDLSQWKKDAPPERIPCQRVREKEDRYFSGNDFAGAERHLRYWLEEARRGRDDRGLFFVENELMGLYRKTGREEEAFRASEEALRLLDSPEIGRDSVSAATAYLNTATVCKAFSQPERAAELYREAQRIYERDLEAGDPRLAGLYNNLALALTDLREYDEAAELFRKAIDITEREGKGRADAAISCLNLCDTLMIHRGSYRTPEGNETDAEDPEGILTVPEETEEEIRLLLDRAEAYLQDPELPHDGYFAYAAEKCSPVFAWYGRFGISCDLQEEAARIYGKEEE